MDAWLPVSHKLSLAVQIAGVQADVTYVSSLEYTHTVLNPNLPESFFEPVNQPSAGKEEQEAEEQQQEEQQQEEEITAQQEKIREILEKDELSDRDMARLTKMMEKETEKADTASNKLEVEGTAFSIAPDAVKNDSTFWNAIRPVPLTQEEKSTIVTRDSIYGVGSPGALARRDSLMKSRQRKARARDFIIGKTFHSANRKTRIVYGGIADFSMLSFNTVDGWSYGQEISYDYRPTRQVAYRSNLKAGYAFSRKAPDIIWNSNILYAAPIRAKVSLNMRYRSDDFNIETGIPGLTNTAYSLFYRENHSKRFENISAILEHRMDLATGLVFYATAELADRRELTNHSDFSFLFRQNKDYTPNHPEAMDPDLAIFDRSRLFAGQVRLEYTKDYYYRLRNGRKQYFKSAYPTLYTVYRQAFPAESDGWAGYSLLYGGLSHEREVGLLSTLRYRLEGGGFLQADAMHFSDYMHFKASPLLFDMAGFQETFLLLDHYRASTNDYFVQAHSMLTSSYIAIKMLPWFSERLWNESLALSYLYTPGVPHHVQLGYSINDIGFLFDVGIYTAFENWRYHGTALRFYMRF